MSNPPTPSAEPFFVAQTVEPMTSEQRVAWREAQAKAAGEAGATFCRAARHPQHTNVLLLEGWVERPEDQGAPRFQLTTT